MSDFFEGFEGGTNGGTITTSNTGFGDVGPASFGRFSDEHVHSGSLAATTIAATRFRHPYDFSTVVATPSRAGDFWFYYTETGEHTEQAVFMLHASPAPGDLVAGAEQVVALIVGPTGDWRVDYTNATTTVSDSLASGGPDTWNHVTWTFEGGVYEITLDDGTTTDTSTNPTDPTLHPAFAYAEHWAVLETGYQNWLDDIGVVPVAVVTPPTEVVRVTRQFPRDDAYGLGSAPRIHPPPRRGRLVGGQT